MDRYEQTRAGMLGDALKSTRNLHRLVITVSLITLLFSSSLDLPRETIQWKSLVDQLIEADFLAYEDFVEEKVAEFMQANLAPIGTNVTGKLEALNLPVFNLHHVGDVLTKPIHVGKIEVRELPLSEVSAANLVSLDALNGLELDREVQVLVPQTKDLVEKISDYLHDVGETGRRVDEVRVGVDVFDEAAQSFLPGESVTPSLSFELHDTVTLGSIPIFSALFTAKIETLQNTSFLHWINRELGGSPIVRIEDGNITFLPTLTRLPKGYREEKLGLLSKALAGDVERAGPKNLSASILGTQVPGLLIIYASPTILLFLAYYFMQHSAHLSKIVNDDPSTFRQFAWLPLAVQSAVRIRTNGRKSIQLPAWLLETITTVIVLPVLALTVLYFQLHQFGGLTLLHTVFIAGSAVGIAYLGTRAIRAINAVRGKMSFSEGSAE